MERLEALCKRLHAFRAFRERVGSFSRPGRLGSIKPYGMIGYVLYVCKHKQKQMGTFARVLERIEVFALRLEAFRSVLERMETFGRLGSLVSIIPYGMYGMYVAGCSRL